MNKLSVDKSPAGMFHADREQEKQRFLTQAGWSGAIFTPIAGDASTRSYDRLNLGTKNAILMNAPLDAEEPACPPSAGNADRRALGYNATARLAGPNLNAFLAIAKHLTSRGLSAPDIFAADAKAGFALIEDLGAAPFAKVIPEGHNEEELYSHAVDALLHLHEQGPHFANHEGFQLLDYDEMALGAETELLIEWYWPWKFDRQLSDDQQVDYIAAWRRLYDQLPAPSVLALRDYHAENLLWLPDRHGVSRVGMIDFQDALLGDPAYDLASLLEDARRAISADLTSTMLARYIRAAKAQKNFNEEQFRQSYAILGAQRNAKILGIFARLAIRDGKKQYLDLVPRVESYFRNNLAHPALKEIADIFDGK